MARRLLDVERPGPSANWEEIQAWARDHVTKGEGPRTLQEWRRQTHIARPRIDDDRTALVGADRPASRQEILDFLAREDERIRDAL